MTPGEAAFRVWYVACVPPSQGGTSQEWAAATWQGQLPGTWALWERIAQAAIDTAGLERPQEERR